MHTGAKPKPVKRVYSEGNFPPLDVPTGLRKLRIKFKKVFLEESDHDKRHNLAADETDDGDR